jgi:hypothetical protein
VSSPGVGPFDMTDAPALDVLELEEPRRSTHRCDSNDDVPASPIGEECSKVDHGHRCAFYAQRKESALGVRGAIPGSEALSRKGLADLASEKRTWGSGLQAPRSRV